MYWTWGRLFHILPGLFKEKTTLIIFSTEKLSKGESLYTCPKVGFPWYSKGGQTSVCPTFVRLFYKPLRKFEARSFIYQTLSREINRSRLPLVFTKLRSSHPPKPASCARDTKNETTRCKRGFVCYKKTGTPKFSIGSTIFSYRHCVRSQVLLRYWVRDSTPGDNSSLSTTVSTE